MKTQALFSLKDKSKKLNCRLLQFLFSALRVKPVHVNAFTTVRSYKFTLAHFKYVNYLWTKIKVQNCNSFPSSKHLM